MWRTEHLIRVKLDRLVVLQPDQHVTQTSCCGTWPQFHGIAEQIPRFVLYVRAYGRMACICDPVRQPTCNITQKRAEALP